MTTLSPTRLRRMFNVRSERLLRSIFGQHFRTYMALQTKFYQKRWKKGLSHEQMVMLENRWLRMHAKWLRENENENAPGLFMV